MKMQKQQQTRQLEYQKHLQSANKARRCSTINIDKALASYTEAERKEIMDLANQIDAKKVDNLMNYASNVLLGTFEASGEFLKRKRFNS